MDEQSLVPTQPGESLEMQLANEVGGVLCNKCQYPVDVMDMSARTHANYVVCKNCHNVDTMLRKHLVQLPQQWDLMNSQEQTTFFQNCLKLKDESGVLRFKNVRSELKNALVTKSMEIFSRGAKGEFQPLSYWAKQGYDCDLIQKKAPKMEHPVLGDTYRVDIFVVSTERVNQEIEETLVNCTRQVKRKSAAEPKAASSQKALKGEKPADQPPPEPTEEEKKTKQIIIDLDGLESDSEDCKVAP